MNYEQELLNLKNAQKNAAMADLQATRDSSLSNLQAEEAKIRPEYAAQRNTLNANNRVAARNFQEYLANTGRANSGIGAQYEMGRQNSLQRGLSALQTQEAADLSDIARRRSDIQNAYNSGLASANANVEANYINNLLAQRQQQWERDFAQKQFDEQVRQYNQNRQDELNRLAAQMAVSSSRASGSRSSSKKTSSKKTEQPQLTLQEQNDVVQNEAKPGERYIKQVKTAQGGTVSQLWMKTADGKDYRIA